MLKADQCGVAKFDLDQLLSRTKGVPFKLELYLVVTSLFSCSYEPLQSGDLITDPWGHVLLPLLDRIFCFWPSSANQVSLNRGEYVVVCPKTTRTVLLLSSNARCSGKLKADTDRTRLHNATRFLCFQK